MQEVKIQPLNDNFKLPVYSTIGSAGADLFAVEDDTIFQWQVKMLPLGFALELPQGYKAQIFPRSSMGKKGVIIPNSPATVDSDYRGEVMLLLMNTQQRPMDIRVGDKIAQMEVIETNQVSFTEVDKINDTLRSDGGFGSTGR